MASTTPIAAIVDVKLHPVIGMATPVARSKLDACSAVLDGSQPVTIVVAPTGYGKSTLMASWHVALVARGVPCAWLSLDEGDDDKARLVRHLVAALRKADALGGRAVEGHLAADFTSGVKPLLESLAGDLAKVRQRIVLFVDDLHTLRDAEAIEVIDWLINYAPRTMQLVVGSREEPPLRLAGLRLRQQLFEVGVDELQFSIDDAAQLLRNRLGRDLPAPELRQLVAKTEGWPAALELAAVALQGPLPAAAFVDQFAGTDRGIVDYLREVLLARLDEPLRSFVLRIALFDRISIPLARAIDDGANVQALIDELRTRNLFLIALDRSGTWFRFHALVGEFFRERFMRADPAAARACLVRGAEWMHAKGLAEEAVNAAIRAQDWELATRWLAECVEELASRRGYHHTILRWLQVLPPEWVDRHPAIRIQYAFSLSFYPRHLDYRAQLHRLQQLLDRLQADAATDGAQVDELRSALEMQHVMSLGLRDDPSRIVELASAWLARWPDAPTMRKGIVANVLGFGHKASGDIERGLAVLADARGWLEQAEGYYSLSWSFFLQALLELKRGSYREARRVCVDGLELVERKLHGHPGQAGMLHTVLALVAYEFDEIAAAVEHIEHAMASTEEYAPADAVILAYLTHARLQRLRHDEASAMAVLHEGQQLGERRGLPRVAVTLAAEECNGLARAGRHDEARLVAKRFGFDALPAPDAAPTLAVDKAFRAASRYLLQLSPRLVAQALGGAIEQARHRGLAHREVELLLMRALAQRKEGDWDAALADLRDALVVAAPRGYLRQFLDEAEELRSLFERLDPERMRGSEAAPLARLLRERLRHVADPRDVADAAAVEALTRREIAILKRLESGLSNKEIAESIFISEGTLKWHLHNVYGKLGVKNRSGALARARGLELL
jgi:ATP/maltotriose-dependent transcriptional regulator MalT